ncbi:MAG: signal peptidase I [Acidimicrobiales bacterium]
MEHARHTKGHGRRSASFWALATILLAALVVFGYAVISGEWQVQPIVSGSMEPGFSVGGVVVAQREPLADLTLRSVIVTHPPHMPHYDLVHRIVEIKTLTADSAVVQTMGDDNTVPDPFLITVHGPWIYQVRFSVPFVGYPALWVHSPRGKVLLLAIAAALILLVATRVVLDRRRRKRKTITAGPAGPADA